MKIIYWGMALTPEGKVKAAVVKILKEEGVYYFFPATHGYGRSGVPDIICCVDGFFLGIECKARGGKVTKLQEREMIAIRRAKGVAIIADKDHTHVFVRGMIKLLREKKEKLS